MYVKLDDVLHVLKTRRFNTRSIEVSDNIQQCINQIKKLPVCESGTKGKWNYDGTCSICGSHVLANYTNFCPKCGSDMREA